MTDIQRQIVPLIKRLSAALADAADDSSVSLSEADRAHILEMVRQALPSGYGVATGRVVDAHGEAGASLDIIIYDRELLKDGYIQLNDKSGAGFEINPDVAREYLCEGEEWWD